MRSGYDTPQLYREDIGKADERDHRKRERAKGKGSEYGEAQWQHWMSS